MYEEEKKRLRDLLEENPRDQKAADRLHRLELREGDKVLQDARFYFRGYRVAGGKEGCVRWRDFDSRGIGPYRPAGELRDVTIERVDD